MSLVLAYVISFECILSIFHDQLHTEAREHVDEKEDEHDCIANREKRAQQPTDEKP